MVDNIDDPPDKSGKAFKRKFSPISAPKNYVQRQEMAGIRKGMVNFLGNNWWDFWPNICP
jgi:hypothetical protein